MTRRRTYPEEPAGPFPEPPRSFEDSEGRPIELRVADEDDRTALLAMYEAFDPADRAQGIPPSSDAVREEWVDDLLEDGDNVLACHGERIVGHGTLVPDGHGTAELAIFVLQDYQGAGIGTRLLRTLLGYGARVGLERVWLSVERWNAAAVAVYESVGFEPTGGDRFEREMTIRLAAPE